MFGQILEYDFIWTFAIASLWYTAKSWEWLNLFFIVTSKRLSSLLLFSYSTVWYIVSACLDYYRTFKNSVALFLLPNWALTSSTYQWNTLGPMPNVVVVVVVIIIIIIIINIIIIIIIIIISLFIIAKTVKHC